MMEQTLYKGRYGDERPSVAQLELLKKLGIRKEIIEVLDRQTAFELIRKCITQYYEAKFQARHKPKFEVYVRW